MKPLILTYLIVGLVVGGALAVQNRIAGKRYALLAYVVWGLSWPLIIGHSLLEWMAGRR